MKLNKLPILLTVACAVITFYSCTNGPSKMIVKKWQFESIKGKQFDDENVKMAQAKKMLDTIKNDSAKMMLQQSIDMVSKMMETMKTMTMTFKGDGTCESYEPGMNGMETVKGKWTITADGKALVRTVEGTPKADSLTIDELTADKLTLSGPDNTGGRTVITYKAAQ